MGRPDNELLGGDHQELRTESTVFPVELRMRETGANDRGPLASGLGRCFLLLFFSLALAATPTFGPTEGKQRI